MSKKEKAVILIIMAGVCWGIIGIFSRELSQSGIRPLQITFLRSGVAAISLGLYLLLFHRECLKIQCKDIWLFLGTGILSIVFFNICYFVTIQMTTLSIAAILLYTAPCFVMILSFIFFREKITRRKVLAFLIAFSGCALTTGSIGLKEENLSFSGIMIGIGSGFFYALYSIFGRVALKKYSSLTVTVYTFFVATLSLLPFAGVPSLMKDIFSNGTQILCVILLGIISTMLPFLLYTKGLLEMEAGKASVMAFVEPMVATIVGFLLFGEQITFQGSFGIIFIFISIILLNKPEKK